MTKRDMSFASFASGAYKPWGQLRRKNLIARIVYAMGMAVAGLAVLGVVALLAVFAASVAVIGAVVVSLMGAMALIRRKPSKVRVNTDDGKGVYEARKDGSTWTVY
ncbi:hypothetical protein MMA231_00926 [Asticcacaulis sp. MM231]|uniref:hypothetical protein n=1 Tax=Asticcacaulis sp. MM231 TaxID=3157666 RepID=UPI0032D580FA